MNERVTVTVTVSQPLFEFIIMGTDYALFTAYGYCIPRARIDAIVAKLKKGKITAYFTSPKVEPFEGWRDTAVDLEYAMYDDTDEVRCAFQDDYNQPQQFNEMVFFYKESTRTTLFNNSIGGSYLLTSCSIENEREWKDTGLFGGARLPFAVKLAEEEEGEDYDLMGNGLIDTDLRGCGSPEIRQIGEEIIKSCRECRGKWMFSYFH